MFVILFFFIERGFIISMSLFFCMRFYLNKYFCVEIDTVKMKMFASIYCGFVDYFLFYFIYTHTLQKNVKFNLLRNKNRRKIKHLSQI